MKPKKVAESKDAWIVQEKYDGLSHGWVQWKGTNVCMDFFCKCGCHSHVDADFAYHVKCPRCGTVYACNGHVELIELENEPKNCMVLGVVND